MQKEIMHTIWAEIDAPRVVIAGPALAWHGIEDPTQESSPVVSTHAFNASVARKRSGSSYKLQGDAAMMEAETNRARLQMQIQEYNDQHPRNKIVTFTSPTPPWVKSKH